MKNTHLPPLTCRSRVRWRARLAGTLDPFRLRRRLKATGRLGWRLLRDAGRSVDWGLEQGASRALRRLERRTSSSLLQNPVHRMLAERLEQAGRAAERFIPDALAEHASRIRLTRAIGSSPWWRRPARLLSEQPVTRSLAWLEQKSHRAKNGWDASILPTLDRHVCATLGQQLHAVAATTARWPVDHVDSLSDWQALLRGHAEALLDYAHNDPYALVPPGDASDPDRVSASEKELRQLYRAQDALHWVAQMLPHLWV